MFSRDEKMAFSKLCDQIADGVRPNYVERIDKAPPLEGGHGISIMRCEINGEWLTLAKLYQFDMDEPLLRYSLAPAI